MRAILPSALILLMSCGKSDIELVREVASEVKAKPYVVMNVKVKGDHPAPEDEALLRSLETKIDDQRIGRLVSAGFEPGSMVIKIEVENTADAITKLRALALDAGLLKETSFRVMEPREP